MSSPEKAAANKNSVLFGFGYRVRNPDGRWTLRFRWLRIAVVLAVLMVLGYASLATVAYFHFKYRRGYEEASYLKMFTLPFRMDEHRREMGDYQIATARKLLEQGDLMAAFSYVRNGVSRSPRNLDGRLLLSEFYFAMLRRPDNAIEVLRGGREYGRNDVNYVRRYVQALLSQQLDQEVIDFATAELARPEERNPELTRLLALAAATANRFRGNYDRAEDIISEYNLERDIEGLLLSAQVSWERGQRAVAIGKLESSIGRFRSNEPIYAMLVRYYREQGDYDRARQYAVLRNISSPLSIAPRIDFLMILHETDETEREEAEAYALLEQFQSDDRSLTVLARFAAETGNVPLANRIYERALTNGYDLSAFALSLIEAQLVNGNYAAAIQFSDELDRDRPEWLERNRPFFNSLRSIAHFAAGNEELSRVYLEQFMGSSNPRVEMLLSVAERYRKLNGLRQAREILLSAYRANPQNQAALTALVELEIDLGNTGQLAEQIQRLLQMRRPSKALLAKAYSELGSDRFIYVDDREKVLLEINSLLRD